jgi:hypothetical protein
MITICIPTPNRDAEITAACVRSVMVPDAEIRMVPWYGSFAKTVNVGLTDAKTEFVACVNNDTVAPPQWMQMFNHASSRIGIVCPDEGDQALFNPAGELVWGPRGFFGGFWAMPTYLWNKLGGMDERFDPYYCEDTDLIYRVEKAGYKILQDRRIIVRHLMNNTIKHELDRDKHHKKNCERFERKWGLNPVRYQHG